MGFTRWRAGCAATVVALGTALVAALGVATPAAADAKINPGDYVQGNAGRLTFHMTNEHPAAALTRIEMRMPAEFPIAEIYPMSADGWAPQLTMSPVDKSLSGLHGGNLTEVVSVVTWTAVPGSELRPGGAVDLQLSMYSLPLTPQLPIGVVHTFADGSVVSYTARPGAAAAAGERPAPVATLAPPAGAAAGDQTPTETGQDPADQADQAGDAPPNGPGSNLWWMFGLLVLIGAVTAFALVRQRRADPAPDAEEATQPRERATL